MSDTSRIFKKIGKLIYIKQPEFEELNYVSELWADEETMNDVGGTIEFKEERKVEWYKKMVRPTDGKNFYCLIYNLENTPIGEVSFHRYSKKNKAADFNIKIQNKYRNKGYGKEAMKLLLEYYFNEFGGQVMLDEVINEKGQNGLLKFGFDVVHSLNESIEFRITKEKFIDLHGEM